MPAMCTFSDLRQFLDDNAVDVFGPFPCYVANFDSPHAIGRKYVYRGCTKSHGREVCGKSIEGNRPRCGHNPLQPGNNALLYSFQVSVFDAAAAGPPMTATLFADSAVRLLEIEAVDFAKLSEDEQAATIHALTFPATLVNAWFRVLPGLIPVVHKLEKVTMGEVLHVDEFHTPSLVGTSHGYTVPFDSSLKVPKQEHPRSDIIAGLCPMP